MKQSYFLLVITLWGLSYFFFFALTDLSRLLGAYPESDIIKITSYFASVLFIGILLGIESRLGHKIERLPSNWIKFILFAAPALILCFYNLIPYVLAIPSFNPLPREFSMVMGVVTGYGLTTCWVRKE